MLDVDFLENFIKGIFDDWFAGKKYLRWKGCCKSCKTKISCMYINKSWFTVYVRETNFV